MSVSYPPNRSAALGPGYAAVAPTYNDPGASAYSSQSPTRVDAKYGLNPFVNEILLLQQIQYMGGGAIQVRNATGGTLNNGPVRISGYYADADSSTSTGNPIFKIVAADASGNGFANALLLSSLADGTTGIAYIGGDFTPSPALDTSGGAIGDNVYLKSGGGMTLTAPSGVDDFVQVIGQIKTVSATGVVAGLVQSPKKLGSSWLQTGSTASGLGIFGDGNDGALVYDGIATVLGVAPVANVYTLTRSIYPSSMSVNAGVTIIPNDYRIVCKGALTLPATAIIKNDGVAAVADVSGAATNFSELGAAGAGNGSNGTTAVGTNGSAFTPGVGANGGAGGAGGSGAGGTGGAQSTNDSVGGTNALRSAIIAAGVLSAFNCYGGGASGGTGSGDGAKKGGGAGSGGGGVYIFAKTIVGAGSITSKGGNGGNGEAAGNCGGGGGGGGGYLVLVTSQAISGITLTVTGGNGGTKTGTGVNGSAGSTGTIYQIVN